MANAHVLIIDDEEHIRRTLSILLRSVGYEVQAVDGGAQGISALREMEYDVILCDLRMPAPDGFDVLRAAKASSPDTMVILITAYAEVETAVQAMREGAYDYLAKPFEPDHMLLTVQKAMERKTLIQDVRLFRQEVGVRYDFSSMIGGSHAIQDVLLLMKKATMMKAPVLITGESGTGKELVAKAIHYNSPRSPRPLITVNCGAIPEHLVESELFGHTKGAFTGAVKAKTGLFEEANGSSLFLDEIGELNLDVQVKLLRAIETGEIRRVGDTRTSTLDIRIIAATNRDLEHEVEQGRFREDLYYRLNVLRIHVPPLRERRSDIPLLVRYFLKKYAGLYG
ncbi:MAG: sigma-54-dependent Fis family transcriptional regulator, partial [Candidatus Latescibacteria bacterium]|nr:sigma-54-dependent Fis family transcriptional regulator [Candidatus Latescibacterota bacterium]